MKQHKDVVRLKHMLDAAEKACSLTNGKSQDDLNDDEILGFAIVRLLEIIGEAGNSVSAELKNKNHHIPWKQIIAVRNHLIHGYFDIDYDIIWKIVKDELPQLLQNLKKILNEE